MNEYLLTENAQYQLSLVMKRSRKLKKRLEEQDEIKYQLKQLKKKAKKLKKIIKNLIIKE